MNYEKMWNQLKKEQGHLELWYSLNTLEEIMNEMELKE